LIPDASSAIIASMANLNIRNVPESVRRGLRLRAARKGRSMEAELRTILAEAVRRETGKTFDPESLQNFILGLFKGKRPGLADELIRERRREARQEKRQ
jgi:plasmid stability protein